MRRLLDASLLLIAAANAHHVLVALSRWLSTRAAYRRSPRPVGLADLADIVRFDL